MGQESTRHLAPEGQGQVLGTGSLTRCEKSRPPRSPENSLSLQVMGGPIQTHDQIFFPRFQVKTARGSNQEVPGLTSSSLSVFG